MRCICLAQCRLHYSPSPTVAPPSGIAIGKSRTVLSFKGENGFPSGQNSEWEQGAAYFLDEDDEKSGSENDANTEPDNIVGEIMSLEGEDDDERDEIIRQDDKNGSSPATQTAQDAANDLLLLSKLAVASTSSHQIQLQQQQQQLHLPSLSSKQKLLLMQQPIAALSPTNGETRRFGEESPRKPLQRRLSDPHLKPASLSLNGGGGAKTNRLNARKVGLSDFEMVRVLGKGSFGKVILCRKKDTGMLFAVKVLRKQFVRIRKQVQHTNTERSVLGKIDHPFIVKLHFAFQTGDKLHFVLTYAPGGELFFHLGRAGRFSEDLGRFYTAEISLALGYLHSKHVVYRDLKPENILLDREGHVLLADFGLSKEGIVSGTEGTHSFCGTPEYLAPEVLNRVGHGTSVDWWSLGALLYEMLTGLPPWYNQERQKLFAGIRRGTLGFPSHVGPKAQMILSAFLQRDPLIRLGSKRDVEEVKEHPFFEAIDWNLLLAKKMQPPFCPCPTLSQNGASSTKSGATLEDTKNFEDTFTRMPFESVAQGTTDSTNTLTNQFALPLESPSNESFRANDRLSCTDFAGFTFEDNSHIAALHDIPTISTVTSSSFHGIGGLNGTNGGGTRTPPFHTFNKS